MISENIGELAKALSAAQATMMGAIKDKDNKFFKSSYADLASVFRALNEPFSKNGLSVTQTMRVLDNGRTALLTRLLHSSGQFISSEMLLPDIADPQKLGSAITYYRRYALSAIAGIYSEDDDGNGAREAVKASFPKEKRDQLWGVLNSHIQQYPELKSTLLSLCKVQSLSAVTDDQLLSCVNYVRGFADHQQSKL